jgi:phospholipase C
VLTRRKFLQIAAGSAGAAAISGTQLLAAAAASASPAAFPHGSRGIRHIVVLMLENRSFDTSSVGYPGPTAATT